MFEKKIASRRARNCVRGQEKIGFLAAVLATGLSCSPASATGLIIKTTFDSSITRLSNASTVEAAFNTVAAEFSAAFANPVTVNITVSWGSAGGEALSASDVAGSVVNLSGPYTYASLVSNMKANLPYNPGDSTFASAVASLPATDPTKLNKYEIPYAEAKALGMFAPNGVATDGYVGFASGVTYDFDPVGGVTAGAYDFQALAAHELSEVLGRTSGLPSSGRAAWATPLDALRYSAPGVTSFSTSASAYFSIDGGVTDLGNYNTVAGGDRGDWLNATAGTDSARAFFNTGAAYSFSANDLTALDALGWGSWSPASVGLTSTQTTALSPVGHSLAAVPEPAAWVMMLVGLGLVGGASRTRRPSSFKAVRNTVF